EREVGDRDEPPAAVGTKVDDPAIVSTRIRLRDLGLVALCLPENSESRVEERRLETFLIETLQTLARIHRAEGSTVDVGVTWRWHDVDDLSIHPAEHAEHTAADDLRWLTVDLQILQAVLIGAQPHGTLPVARLEVFLPKIRC